MREAVDTRLSSSPPLFFVRLGEPGNEANMTGTLRDYLFTYRVSGLLAAKNNDYRFLGEAILVYLDFAQKLNPLINCSCTCTIVSSWSTNLAYQAAFVGTISTKRSGK